MNWPQPGEPPHSPFSVLCIDAAVKDDMNSYISQYYNGPSSGESVSRADLHIPEPLCGPTQPLMLRVGTTRPGVPISCCL